MGTTCDIETSDNDFLLKYMATKITVQPGGTYSLKFPWKDSHLLFHSTTLYAKKNQIHGLLTGKDTKASQYV